MSGVDWAPLSARARGLSTRLCPRSELEALAGLGELGALSRELTRKLRLLEGGSPGPGISELETALRRGLSRQLRTLARYAGRGSAVLEVFYAEQERRSVRAVLRGASASVPTDARLFGLLPTPHLPERALTQLAKLPTPRAVASELVLLAYPDAGELLALSNRAQAELFELELALARSTARRMGQAAKRGDGQLARFVEESLDLGNLRTALLLAGSAQEGDAGACFIEGGRALSRERFLEAARSQTRAEAAEHLAHALAGTALEALGKERILEPGRIELRALAQRLATQKAAARREPLGSAPVLYYLSLLEAQATDLYRLAWGAALGAPASLVRGELVTPWS